MVASKRKEKVGRLGRLSSADHGYSQPIPAGGSRIAARQISTTNNLRRFAKRPSLANLSMAQKQIAPMTQIIRTLIKAESIAPPLVLVSQRPSAGGRRPFCLALHLLRKRSSSRATLGQTCTQLHCARFQSARDRTCRPNAKIVQLYRSRTNGSSAAAKVFLSLHFLFQDLTQYQE